MRAFVYLRQSLDRANTGAAVDRQREDCLKLCSERGWEVARTFIDNDVSASSRKPRPAYVDMLKALRNGEAEALVAWHVDRLTRKITDLEELIELAQDTGLRIVTVNGDLDLSNDTGRLVGRILASVARGEVERKGARQKRAQQQAAQQGRPAGGRRAFGYASDGVTIIDNEAQHVRRAYADLLQGASLNSIARRWNAAGQTTTMGGTWRGDNVRSVLRNPRYAGLRTYRGEVVGPATWKALVDEETFRATEALLSMPERRTTANTARRWLLPGLALCGVCGSTVTTGHTQHGKRIYRCRAGSCIARKAEEVDALIAGGEIDGVKVRGIVVDRLSRPDAVELLTEDTTTPAVQAAQERAQAIRERLDDLATGLEEGVLTLAAVRRSSERLHAELTKVEAELHNAVHVDVLKPLVTAGDVEKAWAGYDLARRRQVIDALMTVRLLKPEQARQDFDPETVQIEWKGAGR
jgi:DNA invertase Pin-like site-specific DNA recombinase